MFKIIRGLACVVVLICLSVNQSIAQDKTLCETYDDKYKYNIKEMALIHFADGYGDDSAPRATNRELKQIHIQLNQLILLQQMNAYGCDIPKMPSDRNLYFLEGFECGIKQSKGDAQSKKCDLLTWEFPGDYNRLKVK